MLQQDGFPHLEESGLNEINPCHIYMIGRRPKITLDEQSMKFTEKYIEGRFLVQLKEDKVPIDFRTENDLGTTDVIFQCPYPHTEYLLTDGGGKFISGGKSSLLFQYMTNNYSEYLNFEVLYIGQAYGEAGLRTAPDRLKEHSTLQGIYAEAISRTPDQEIWMILWGFTPLVATAIDGRSETIVTANEMEEENHAERLHRKFITEQQQINFTEATLINYFKPEYNEKFKNKFPNPAHKTYSECYELDIFSVGVELHTSSINCKICSEVINPEWIHLITQPLHNVEERISALLAALPDA